MPIGVSPNGKPDARCGALTASKPREFFCEHCNARCTRGTEGVEYGHRDGCPDRPDRFPSHNSNEYARYIAQHADQ